MNASVSAGLVLMAGSALLLASCPSVSWRAYFIPAVPMALLLLLVISVVRMPAAGSSAHPDTTSCPMQIAGFLIVGSEAVLLGMIPAVSAAMTGYMFAGEGYAFMLMMGVLVGHIGGSRLIKKMGAARVLMVSAGSIFAFGLLWSFLSIAAPVWVFMLGLSTANLFPGLIAYVAERRPEAAAATVAAAGWTGGLGGVALHLMAGFFADIGLPARSTSLFLNAPVAAAVLLLRPK